MRRKQNDDATFEVDSLPELPLQGRRTHQSDQLMWRDSCRVPRRPVAILMTPGLRHYLVPLTYLKGVLELKLKGKKRQIKASKGWKQKTLPSEGGHGEESGWGMAAASWMPGV